MTPGAPQSPPALPWLSLLVPQVSLDGVGWSHSLNEPHGRVPDSKRHIPAKPGEREELSRSAQPELSITPLPCPA